MQHITKSGHIFPFILVIGVSFLLKASYCPITMHVDAKVSGVVVCKQAVPVGSHEDDFFSIIKLFNWI